jgi:hypothetical protein
LIGSAISAGRIVGTIASVGRPATNTVSQLAKMWGYGDATVHRIIAKEDVVIRVSMGDGKRTRPRVPESVARRIPLKMTAPK